MILPIASRELRTAARKRITHIVRFAVPLAAFTIIIGYFDFFTMNAALGTAGARAFLCLANVLFYFSLVPGLFLTADCLSSEKREGTLGLLFLTDLKGRDVVLGKLMATSTQTIAGLIAVIPSLALPVLAGGVAGSELWRVPLVLVNAIFLSLAAGMFWSAVCRDEHATLLATALTLFTLTWLVAALPARWSLASPLITFRGALGVGPATGLFPFLGSLALVQLCGWGFLLLAGPMVQRWWRDTLVWKPRAAAPAAARTDRTAARAQLLDENPVGWLGGVGRVRPWILLSVLITLSFVAGVRGLQNPRAYPPLVVITALFISFALVKFWIGWEASRRFYTDRRTGALELLSVTPLTVDDIVRGEILSLRRQFLVAILFAVGSSVLLMALGLGVTTSTTDSFRLLFDGVVMLGIFLAECFALSWQGLWRGVSARRSWSAPLATLVTSLGLSTITWIGLLLMPVALSVGAVIDLAILWAIIAGVSAFVVHIHARDHLRSEFRRYAAAPTAHPVSAAQELPEVDIPDYAFVGRPAAE